jgi:hypothetical protein
VPILAEEMLERENIPHQNRLSFSLLLSFGQTKERRDTAQAKGKAVVSTQTSDQASILSE